MPFQINSNIYDEADLIHLGGGTFGDVYEIDSVSAAKIYYDKISDDQSDKLLKMCSSSSGLMADSEVGSSIAFPTALAFDTDDQSINGFLMNHFGQSPSLTSLGYDFRNKQFRKEQNYQLTDETAIKLAFDLFQILSVLANRKIVVGDISGSNILFNLNDKKLGFIDLDSAHFEDWESESLGTEGYVDPRIQETDLNSLGGLNFDSKSDVFALTVLVFEFLIGVMPYQFGSDPDSTPEENAKRRVSNLRIIIEGEKCLLQHNMRVRNWQMISEIEERLNSIRKVRGESGRDGEILYDHFIGVFIREERDNLLENLPPNDFRNPTFSVLKRLRGKEVIDELREKFKFVPKPPPHQVPVKQNRIIKVIKRQKVKNITRDPGTFKGFLNTRGIDYNKMIS